MPGTSFYLGVFGNVRPATHKHGAWSLARDGYGGE